MAACVRPMIFTDPAVIPRLVEWLELQRLLGVGKVRFFYYHLAEEIFQVLDYYRRQGLVDFQEASLPGLIHP